MNYQRTKDRAAPGGGALFFFFVFLGAVYIVFVKSQNFGDDSNRIFLAAAPPVAMLLAYAAVLYFAPRFRLSDDQSGDNLYYLGFLYTLVSLAVSLYQFTAGGGAEQIVKNFGIAIFSTIVGLALRVAFNQMRTDPNEIEKKSRLELADAARRTKRELNGVVLEFKNFHRTIEQSIKETISKAFDPLESIAQGSAARMGKSFETFNQHAERLTGNSERTVAALETLTGRLEQIKAPDDLIISRLTPAVEQIESLVRTLKERDAGQAPRIENALNTAQSAAENTKQLADSAKTVIEAGRAAADAASKSTSLLSRTTSTLAGQVNDDMAKLTDTVTKLSAQLQQAAAELNEMTNAAKRERAAWAQPEGQRRGLFARLRR